VPFSPQRSQFGDPALSSAEAMSACGPAAATAFARTNGRNPTLREAVDLAKQVGWTADAGMAGPASEQALLGKMGIQADLTPSADWSRITSDVQGGKPVIISTPRHYFTVSDYDAGSGKYFVGTSGTDLRGGGEWMSADEITSQGRGVNGALHLSAPVAQPNPAARQSFLEANAPNESTPIGDALAPHHDPTGPASPPPPPRPPSSLDVPSAPTDQPSAANPAPQTTPGASSGDLPPWLQHLLAQSAFARGIAQQVDQTDQTMPTPYQLPPLGLPGFRPTLASQYRLPGGG
jgi:hypothetical protein